MMVVRYLVLTLAALCAACAKLTPTKAVQDDAVWAIMHDRLQRNPRVADHPPGELEFSERVRRKSVLPGVSYYWGIYRSPYVSHLSVTVLAARTRKAVTIVQTPSDWEQQFLSTGWQPPDAERAISACVELVSATRPRRSPYGTIQVFTPRLRMGLNVIWQDSIHNYAESPSAIRSESGWVARVTTIEPGKIMKYTCNVGTRGASYVAADSLVGPGLQP